MLKIRFCIVTLIVTLYRTMISITMKNLLCTVDCLFYGFYCLLIGSFILYVWIFFFEYNYEVLLLTLMRLLFCFYFLIVKVFVWNCSQIWCCLQASFFRAILVSSWFLVSKHFLYEFDAYHYLYCDAVFLIICRHMFFQVILAMKMLNLLEALQLLNLLKRLF